MNPLARLRIDPFTLALVSTVALASLVPAHGFALPILNVVTDLAIGLLFFLYGVRLSRAAILQGVGHWRLHVTVLLSSFVLFPLLGLGLRRLFPNLLPEDLYLGVLYLCLLPSTIQASVAFTSMAGGNVPAAICSASLSNLLGMVLTPLLVGLLMNATGAGLSLDTLEGILLQLLGPFVAGQLLRPWLGGLVERHRRILSFSDRGAILLVVYTAFSGAVMSGIWHQLAPRDLATVLAVNALLLGLVLCLTTWTSRRLGFNRADEITLVFCGSKKSLVNGLPMANVLFAGHAVGMLLLPLMLFHQMQLMACAALAQRYAARRAAAAPAQAVAPRPAAQA